MSDTPTNAPAPIARLDDVLHDYGRGIPIELPSGGGATGPRGVMALLDGLQGALARLDASEAAREEITRALPDLATGLHDATGHVSDSLVAFSYAVTGGEARVMFWPSRNFAGIALMLDGQPSRVVSAEGAGWRPLDS